MGDLSFPEIQRHRRGHAFLPPASILDRIPRPYATEHVPAPDKMIWAHWFASNADWWAAELDRDDWLIFGYAKVGSGDGEWGTSSLTEMEQVSVSGRIVTNVRTREMRRVPGLIIVERDCHWEPRKWSEVTR